MSAQPGFSLIDQLVVDPLLNRLLYSPVEFMMIRGSVKCFKFAILNNPQVLEEEKGYHLIKLQDRLPKAAVIGGNMEIIHILEQKGFEFNQCVEDAVRSLRNDILDWILLNHAPTEIPNLLYTSIESFNIPAFCYFLLGQKQDINYNERNPAKFTPLHAAYCKSSNFFIKYCLEHGSNPDILNSIMKKPIQYKRNPL